MPGGIGKMCLVADPSAEAKTAGTARWTEWIHALMPTGTGKLCLVADPTPEAKAGGLGRWRITPLDQDELRAFAR